MTKIVSEQSLEPFEKNSQNAEKHAWHCSKMSQLITRFANNLAFSSTETLLELYHYGLIPVETFSPNQECIRDIETSIPVLNGKTVQWQMELATGSKPVSTIFLKLGTGNRINHCHLVLSIFKKQQESLKLVTVAKRKGSTVQDSQWTEFVLEPQHPLLPGQFICQLQSPDADNNNTLFLWLTIEDAFSINIQDLSDYGLTPILSFSPTEKTHRNIENSIPIRYGKRVEWELAINSEPVSTICLKLGTGGRINHCHLVLSIFKKQQERFELVTVAKREGSTVQDNQWTEFVLEPPLLPSPGQFICQLQSPDANSNNTLFLWLTVDDTFSVDTIQDLSDYGLTPITSFSPTEKIHRNIESSIPIKCGKRMQWELATNSEPISTIFFKLSTGGRINHCHLVLSIFIFEKQDESLKLVTVAKREGSSVEDNQWTEFVLEPPLLPLPGLYICQLQSPDADNNNTLFLRLTIEDAGSIFSINSIQKLSDYGLTPILSFSPTEKTHRDIENSIPISSGKRVQWELARNSEPVSTLCLKLGTGGRINHCHLVLSIFKKQQERFELVTVAKREGSTVQDNQWTEFVLEPPLLPLSGQFICQLQSPDANNNNTLFLWLTVDDTFSSIQDLSGYGLTPIMSFLPTQKIHRNIERSIPIKPGTKMQWELAKNREPISTIFLKLGTGDRINHCQLVLSIFRFKKQDDSFELVTVAKRECSSIEDNEWTKFVLEPPLLPLPAQYICQLQLADVKNNSTLFLWLTVKSESEQRQGLANYCYVLPPSLEDAERPGRHSHAERGNESNVPVVSVSVIMVVDEETPYLHQCLNSIVTQIYPHWELCIVADSATTVLDEYCRTYPNKIKLADNQTSNPYNTALEMVTGEYVAIMQPVDLLTEDALLEVVKWIRADSLDSVDMLYSDEDKVNEGGIFDEPYFKPDWATEMLKGFHYTGQLSVYRTQMLKKIGGFRGELLSQLQLQLWDIALRFTAHSQRIQHIPKILYHKRRLPPILTSKTQTLKMVQAALDREKQGGHVTHNTSAPNTCLVHYPVQGQPLVSIIIPTKDMAQILAQSIEAIRTITTYPHWEIIIVDNGSTEAATLALFKKYQAELGTAFSVSRHDIPFNFSKLVNQGVKAAQGEIILLLNNDTEILGPPDWLQEMIGFAQLPEIAGVGSKLLYPSDNTIQHVGVICGVGGIANHSHRQFSAESRGYFDRIAMVANYSAITGACMMVKRKLWDQINGFDEKLPIAFNDIDFCLKLHTKGLRHVVLPHVTIYHHESKTRGLEDTAAKRARLSQYAAYMKWRWGTLLRNDPFYNPHLTRKTEDFVLSRDSIYYCGHSENHDSTTD